MNRARQKQKMSKTERNIRQGIGYFLLFNAALLLGWLGYALFKGYLYLLIWIWGLLYGGM